MNNITKKVFNGEGFLTNYCSSWCPRQMPSHIKLVNPLKLCHKIKKFNYFYDKYLFDKLLDAKIDILQNKEIVFSEWNNKIYNTPEELQAFLNKNLQFKYMPYRT